MGVERHQTIAVGATQLLVSASFVNLFKPAANEWFGDLRYAAGGSLEILKPQHIGESTAAGGSFKGLGYLVPSTGYQINSTSAVYLGTSGASTAIAHLTIHYTHGASLFA